MSSTTLNNLLKEYEQKKYIIELNFEKEKNNFYKAHPELDEVENKLGKLAIDISKAILARNSELENKLRDEFDKLKEQKNHLLSNITIPKRSLLAII